MQKQELLKKAQQSLMYITNRPEIVFTRGKGDYLYDTEGREYLDFIAGWAVCALGHSPDVIIEALTTQAKQLINPSPAYYNQPMIELAALLTANSCLDKVFFANCGAEANEGAVKLARKYGKLHKEGAYEIITTWHGFHGRTLAMMAASGKKHWDELYLPRPEGFLRVELNDLAALKKQISSRTIAIMLEPIQGEGGVNPADKEYMQAVRQLCDEKGILLILDEVQTGVGRLGTLFGYELFGIEPDIMTLAKGIGGGFPLAALLAKDKFCCFQPGDQGGTYCGAPLATAVGMAVLEEVITKDIPASVREQGNYLKERLNALSAESALLQGARGEGLLLGLALAKPLAPKIVERALAAGLIINAPNDNTIRFMPALTVTRESIDRMLKIFGQVVAGIDSE